MVDITNRIRSVFHRDFETTFNCLIDFDKVNYKLNLCQTDELTQSRKIVLWSFRLLLVVVLLQQQRVL